MFVRSDNDESVAIEMKSVNVCESGVIFLCCVSIQETKENDTTLIIKKLT
jgi:hypothetical protein